MKKISELNNYLKFFPLLILYIIICIIKQQNILVGDEGRYLQYGSNLLNGFYASPQYKEYSFLWNGPGYPLFLSPFVYFKTSLIIPKLFNAVFLYLGLIYFYKSLLFFIDKKKAFFISLVLGLYYPLLLESLPKILTEAISFLLISLFVYNYLMYLKNNKSKNLWFSSIALGYLVLTKVIFGYILIASLLILIPFLFLNKKVNEIKKFLLILFLGFCITVPYLIYTYSITNKLVYYGNSGGMSLYWMSSPFEGETGDWHLFETLNEEKDIERNHINFINSLKDTPPVEKDIILKKKALENILNNKSKYFKNWISNLGRIFYGYPHDSQKPTNRLLFYVIPNTIFLISFLITLFISIIKYRHLNISVLLLALFSLIYIGVISLFSSYHRFLYPILPVILIWICYIFDKYILIKIELFKEK